MQLRIQVVLSAADGSECVQEVLTFERSETTLAAVGLSLAEAKDLLQQVQQVLVQQQVDTFLEQQRACPHCGKQRQLKQSTVAPFRTLFGLVEVANPRWWQCDCQAQPTRTVRPLGKLLRERSSPELLYLESKWSALMAYGVSTKLLHEVLPIDRKHSVTTTRNHTLHLARRREQLIVASAAINIEAPHTAAVQAALPDGPMAIGLDGGIVRARRGARGVPSGNLFEVIVGKSILSFRRDEPSGQSPPSKCFALVRSIDQRPAQRLMEVLAGQGMQANQQVSFFTDGGDTVRHLPQQLHPQAEQILDWFHASVRIRVLQQCARGLRTQGLTAASVAAAEQLELGLESVKHYLWHGNSRRALEELARIGIRLSGWENAVTAECQRSGSTAAQRMLKYVRELESYISNNNGAIVNYGERYRNGERISTGFVESTINQVVSKRMVKKQQMQWTPEGAHLLLQVRTQVLNDDWEGTFRGWYPGFRSSEPALAELEDAA